MATVGQGGDLGQKTGEKEEREKLLAEGEYLKVPGQGAKSATGLGFRPCTPSFSALPQLVPAKARAPVVVSHGPDMNYTVRRKKELSDGKAPESLNLTATSHFFSTPFLPTQKTQACADDCHPVVWLLAGKRLKSADREGNPLRIRCSKG